MNNDESGKVALTHREAKYVANRLQGMTKQDAMLAAGFSAWLARIPQRIETQEMRDEIARLQAELVEHTLQAGLIDAAEIHEYLTEAIRADIADIKNDDHTYKPLSKWPLIWRQMYEGGDLEIETKSVRSHDGSDGEKRGGWDESGIVITKVKVRFTKRSELLKLAMQHKGVDAMVQSNTNNSRETAEEVMKAIDQRIAEGRQRAARAILPASTEQDQHGGIRT